MKLTNKILGDDPWEIEIDLQVKMGKDPMDARFRTIMHWARWGDLRPLRAGIDGARRIDDKTIALDEATFLCLRELIKRDWLVISRKGKSSGRRKSPDKFVRDLVGVRRYIERYYERLREKRLGKFGKGTDKAISDTTFEEVAREIGMTEGALREAVRTMLHDAARATLRGRNSPTHQTTH